MGQIIVIVMIIQIYISPQNEFLFTPLICFTVMEHINLQI